MVDDVTPDQVRARRFDMIRRGYDRAEVDAFLDGVASQLEDLSARVVEAKASALAIGIDDPEALANELKNVGGEVGAVLEAARAAAEGLRTRAAKDAEVWRADAERESTVAVADATEQSQSMRASAWNEGTSMLTSAEAESHSVLETTQEESLFMRAEAERDALRLTSDAKRDKEELLRVARLDADTIIEEARTESDGVLAAADKQAEAAQERARALEDRRSELLSELEATRTSISQLEEEIDSRRQALEIPDPVPEPEPDARTHHSVDSGSVKIVAPSKVVTLRPVDTDEFVADVEAIRSANMSKAEEAATEEIAPAEEVATVAVIAPPPLREVIVVEPVEEPEPVVPEVVTQPPNDSAGSSADEISSLFAKLRDDTTEQPAVVAEVAEVDDEPVAAPEPQPEPVAPSKPKPKRKAASVPEKNDAGSPQTAEAATTASDQGAAAKPSGPLAAQNAALKAVKRSLVDLQNETLEALRTDETWTPEEGFTDRFGEPFEAYGASLGVDTAADSGSAFASDLQDAVTSAISDERGHGSGSRAVASAASKVFRTWRSDEAERRLLALTP
jgi:DivIVA domain-containing protein